jgi:hypothetical protein
MVDVQFLRRLFGLDSSLLRGGSVAASSSLREVSAAGSLRCRGARWCPGPVTVAHPLTMIAALPVTDGRVRGQVQVVDVTVSGTDGLMSRTLKR